MSTRIEVPLFPLNTVLLPGGELPLRVFELRYRRLLDLCGYDLPFGVILIRVGAEVGEPAFTCDVGTLAVIEHKVAMPDGALGVMAHGEDRFRVVELRVEEDGLMFGVVDILPPDEFVPVPEEYRFLVDQLESHGIALPDAGFLAWRLADVLPLENAFRQQLLEEDDVSERLTSLRVWMADHVDQLSDESD